jgi:hypothetical protein
VEEYIHLRYKEGAARVLDEIDERYECIFLHLIFTHFLHFSQDFTFTFIQKATPLQTWEMLQTVDRQ